MEKKDISLLVLNSIKDEKRIIDNYDFYNDTDSDGLNSEFFKAKCYLGCLENYYGGSPFLEDALSFLHSYYEPYMAEFEVIETLDMGKAKRLTFGCLYGAAISTLLTAFVDDFFPIALTMSTLSLISHLYVKTREMQRAGIYNSLKINDDEAKSLTKQELSDFLDSEKKTVLKALAAVYPR